MPNHEVPISGSGIIATAPARTVKMVCSGSSSPLRPFKVISYPRVTGGISLYSWSLNNLTDCFEFDSTVPSLLKAQTNQPSTVLGPTMLSVSVTDSAGNSLDVDIPFAGSGQDYESIQRSGKKLTLQSNTLGSSLPQYVFQDTSNTNTTYSPTNNQIDLLEYVQFTGGTLKVIDSLNPSYTDAEVRNAARPFYKFEIFTEIGISSWVSNKYLPVLDQTTGLEKTSIYDGSNYLTTNDAAYKYVVVACAAGDRFKVKGKSEIHTEARLWAFADADYKVIQMSDLQLDNHNSGDAWISVEAPQDGYFISSVETAASATIWYWQKVPESELYYSLSRGLFSGTALKEGPDVNYKVIITDLLVGDDKTNTIEFDLTIESVIGDFYWTQEQAELFGTEESLDLRELLVGFDENVTFSLSTNSLSGVTITNNRLVNPNHISGQSVSVTAMKFTNRQAKDPNNESAYDLVVTLGVPSLSWNTTINNFEDGVTISWSDGKPTIKIPISIHQTTFRIDISKLVSGGKLPITCELNKLQGFYKRWGQYNGYLDFEDNVISNTRPLAFPLLIMSPDQTIEQSWIADETITEQVQVGGVSTAGTITREYLLPRIVVKDALGNTLTGKIAFGRVQSDMVLSMPPGYRINLSATQQYAGTFKVLEGTQSAEYDGSNFPNPRMPAHIILKNFRIDQYRGSNKYALYSGLADAAADTLFKFDLNDLVNQFAFSSVGTPRTKFYFFVDYSDVTAATRSNGDLTKYITFDTDTISNDNPNNIVGTDTTNKIILYEATETNSAYHCKMNLRCTETQLKNINGSVSDNIPPLDYIPHLTVYVLRSNESLAQDVTVDTWMSGIKNNHQYGFIKDILNYNGSETYAAAIRGLLVGKIEVPLVIPLSQAYDYVIAGGTLSVGKNIGRSVMYGIPTDGSSAVLKTLFGNTFNFMENGAVKNGYTFELSHPLSWQSPIYKYATDGQYLRYEFGNISVDKNCNIVMSHSDLTSTNEEGFYNDWPYEFYDSDDPKAPEWLEYNKAIRLSALWSRTFCKFTVKYQGDVKYESYFPLGNVRETCSNAISEGSTDPDMI